jgi:hypothetical protein
MPRTADAIKADLQALAAEVTPAEAAVQALYARRLALYIEAQGLDPKPTRRQLAEWAGSTEGAVHQVLRKANAAAEGRPRRTYGKVATA